MPCGIAGRVCRVGVQSGSTGRERRAGGQGGNAVNAKVRSYRALVSSVTLLVRINYAPEQQQPMTAEGGPGEKINSECRADVPSRNAEGECRAGVLGWIAGRECRAGVQGGSAGREYCHGQGAP